MINCQRDSCANCPDIEECWGDELLLDLQTGHADERTGLDLRLIHAFAEDAGYETVREIEGADPRTFVLM